MTEETPIITLANYILWTGDSLPNMSEAEWRKYSNAAAERLRSFLCLDELPETLPDDLEELLANFISAVRVHSGSRGEVESKHVRNFIITFRSKEATNAFAEIGAQFGDVIAKYSQCGSSIVVEKSGRYCCGR